MEVKYPFPVIDMFIEPRYAKHPDDDENSYVYITPKYIVAHEVANPINLDAPRFIQAVNKPNAQSNFHEIVDKNGVYRALPVERLRCPLGWQALYHANLESFGIEMSHYTNLNDFLLAYEMYCARHAFWLLTNDWDISKLKTHHEVTDMYKSVDFGDHSDPDGLFLSFGISIPQYKKDVQTWMDILAKGNAEKSLYTIFFDGKQQGAFGIKNNAYRFGWSSYNNGKKDTYLLFPEGDKYTFDMHQGDNPDKPNFKVFQYDTFLKPFADQAEAVTYAKLWDHSSVVKISNGEWVWDNYPKDQPKPIPQPQPEPTPIPTPPVTPQPESSKNPIMGENKATLLQLVTFVKRINPNFNPDIAKTFLDISAKYGIRGDVAFCQSIHEADWFRFTGDVKADQDNFAGIGATGGVAGNRFATIVDGVTAQMQHLFAYACTKPLPEGEVILDPRFKLVTRGIAPNWEDLAGHWAVIGYEPAKYKSLEEALAAKDAYGDKIVKIYNTMLQTVTDSPIPVPTVPPIPTTPQDPDTNLDPVTKSYIYALAEFLIKLFLKMIGKKDIQK